MNEAWAGLAAAASEGNARPMPSVYDVIRVWFNYRLPVVRHTLQEDHTDWFPQLLTTGSKAESTHLLVIHDFFLDPNLGAY